jgi:hypothetical protein
MNRIKKNIIRALKHFEKVLICVMLLCPLISCKYDKEPKVYNHFPAFIVLPKAQKTYYVIQESGVVQLGYQMKEAYPALTSIRDISSRLEKNGWTPLKEDFLNPGLKSPTFQRWDSFEDASSPPEKIVHQWIGDWKDKYGNIVRYTFRYTYPKYKKYPKLSQPNLSDLDVVALYSPSSLVNLMKEEIAKRNSLSTGNP